MHCAILAGVLQLALPIHVRYRWPDVEHLPAIQETIYRHLRALVPDWQHTGQCWQSAATGPQLIIDIVACSRYTSSLRLYHRYVHDPNAAEPNAHVRCYHDFRTAELIAFHTVPGFARHGIPPPGQRAGRILRRHLALCRWLEYLLELGHHRALMQPDDNGAAGRISRQPLAASVK